MYLFIMMECLCSLIWLIMFLILPYLILLHSGIRCICSGNHHISPHNWYGTLNYILTVNNCVTCNTFTDRHMQRDRFNNFQTCKYKNSCNINMIIYYMHLNTVDSQFHGDHVFWDDRLCSKHILRIKCSSLWLRNLLYFCVRHTRILPYNIIYRVFIRISWLWVFLYVYNYRSESHNEISEIQ